ncbi:hypothetical protein [Pedococcus aerophilus]
MINDLLGDPRVSDNYEAATLRRKRTSYAVATAVLTIFEAAVAAILLPLAVQVFEEWDGAGQFIPLRAGLLLAQGALLVGAVVAGVMAVKLWRKR